MYLAGAPVESVEMYNDTYLVVVAGDGTGQTFGPAELHANTGAYSHSVEEVFTYLTVGNISAVFPAHGQLGTVVTISGTGFFGGGSSIAYVLLGNDTAALQGASGNDTYVVVADTGNGSVNISVDVVVVANTGARIVSIGGYQHLCMREPKYQFHTMLEQPLLFLMS